MSRAWTRQPQGVVRLAQQWSRGSSWVFNAGSGRLNLGSANGGSVAATRAINPTAHGVGTSYTFAGGGDYLSQLTLPATNNLVVLALVVTRTPTAWQAPLYDRGGIYGIAFDAAGNYNYQFDGNEWSYSTGLAIPANSLVAMGHVVTPTTVTSVVNGKFDVRSGLNNAARSLNSSGTTVRLGEDEYSIGRTFDGEILAAGIFADSGITDAQLLEWSRRPWSLFAAPRQVWVQLGAASGGAGPIAFNAETGAVAVTGSAATLNRNLLPIDAQPASYAVSGTAATLARGWNLDAQPGTYSVSGIAATLARGWNLDAQPGTYAVTGIAATLARGWNLDAQPGTFAETGIAATLDYAQPGAYTLDCQPGTYAVTGAAATLTYVPLTHYSIDAAPGTFTLTGIAGTLTYNQIDAYEITASPGSFAVTGADATLTYTLASIWTDISGSTTSWTDQAAASTIWTDL